MSGSVSTHEGWKLRADRARRSIVFSWTNHSEVEFRFTPAATSEVVRKFDPPMREWVRAFHPASRVAAKKGMDFDILLVASIACLSERARLHPDSTPVVINVEELFKRAGAPKSSSAAGQALKPVFSRAFYESETVQLSKRPGHCHVLKGKSGPRGHAQQVIMSTPAPVEFYPPLALEPNDDVVLAALKWLHAAAAYLESGTPPTSRAQKPVHAVTVSDPTNALPSELRELTFPDGPKLVQQDAIRTLALRFLRANAVPYLVIGSAEGPILELDVLDRPTVQVSEYVEPEVLRERMRTLMTITVQSAKTFNAFCREQTVMGGLTRLVVDPAVGAGYWFSVPAEGPRSTFAGLWVFGVTLNQSFVAACDAALHEFAGQIRSILRGETVRTTA